MNDRAAIQPNEPAQTPSDHAETQPSSFVGTRPSDLLSEDTGTPLLLVCLSFLSCRAAYMRRQVDRHPVASGSQRVMQYWRQLVLSDSCLSFLGFRVEDSSLLTCGGRRMDIHAGGSPSVS
jgi:hypothetical protein